MRMVRIGVIVEGSSPNRPKRSNFWPDAVNRFEEKPRSRIGLDLIEPTRFGEVRAGSHDVLIIKWDAANNDPDFGSDEVLRQLEFSHDALKDFVRNGGILIVECQSHHWVPYQKAYHTILSPFCKVKVLDDGLQRPGLYVRRARIPYSKGQYSLGDDHPVLRYLPEKIFPSPDLGAVSKPWFDPPTSVTPHTLDKTYPSKVYSGWFTGFSRNCRPLLYSDEGKHPVMIWCPYERGAVIASTMFLASSFVPQLMRNILTENFRQDMETYVKSVLAISKEARINWIASATSGAVTTALGIVFFGGMVHVPFPSDYIIVGGLTILTGLFLSAARFRRRI